MAWWGKWGERAAGRAMQRREERGRREREVIEEMAVEFTPEELREFLEADRYPIAADPRFKEELRQKIWKLLQSRIQRPSDDS